MLTSCSYKASSSSVSSAHRLWEKKGKQREESAYTVCVCVRMCVCALYVSEGVSCGELQTQQAFPCRTLSYRDSLINIKPTPSLTHTHTRTSPQITTHRESHLRGTLSQLHTHICAQPRSKSFGLISHLFSIFQIRACVRTRHHISIKPTQRKSFIHKCMRSKRHPALMRKLSTLLAQ